MRFGYVLLGLVTLTSVQVSTGQCSNGFEGVQSGDVCCDAACGTCGGNGCARQPGGVLNCCVGAITRSGMMCSDTQAAPCIVDNDDMCSNGLLGTQNGDICCGADCLTCGGAGCNNRVGGPDSCCTSRIRDSGMLCSDTQGAPCIINNDATCSNGLLGTQSGDICCGADCLTCGGSDCNNRVGGPDSCCKSRIRDSGMLCSETQAAPCIVNDDVFCSNGVNGVEDEGTCCESQCGTCGGFGCRDRPGGQEACCANLIQASGNFCDDTMMSPCII